MIRQRNVGPVLALTGAGIALAAIIAGFIIVGGPGNARDRRLDELTSQRISQIVGVVQCAFEATGVAPIDYATATKTRSVNVGPGQPPVLCENGNDFDPRIVPGETPANAGDITYKDTGPTQVTLCAKFNTQSDPGPSTFFYPFADVYPTLGDPHPAGVHCYNLDLVKANPSLGTWPAEPVVKEPVNPVP